MCYEDEMRELLWKGLCDHNGSSSGFGCNSFSLMSVFLVISAWLRFMLQMYISDQSQALTKA